MKKVFSLVLVAMLFMLTGCGVNIRQEGNKIFTDASIDEAYAFSSAALKTKGYKTTEESRINHYIIAQPEFNQTFQIEKADKKEVRADVAAKDAETVVTVVAMANGQIDEEASKKVAADAVAEIIAELDKYGKFEATKDGEQVYPVATLDQVNAYIQEYLNQNNLQGAKADTGWTVKEVAANNPFNEALTATIVSNADDTNKVTVKVQAALKGNYDVKGNQQYVADFVTKLLAYLDNYPVVEKGLRYTYKYIGFEKAYANAMAALKASGYTLIETNTKDFLITADKNGLKMSVSFTAINNNLAVNLEAFKEGKTGDTKDALTTAITEELNTLQAELTKYQTILITDKLFNGMNQDQVMKVTVKALTSLGYKPMLNKADATINAVNAKDSNKQHFIVINNMGTEGISLEINTAYNRKADNADSIVKIESDKLLKVLGSYDKTDMK